MSRTAPSSGSGTSHALAVALQRDALRQAAMASVKDLADWAALSAVGSENRRRAYALTQLTAVVMQPSALGRSREYLRSPGVVDWPHGPAVDDSAKTLPNCSPPGDQLTGPDSDGTNSHSPPNSSRDVAALLQDSGDITHASAGLIAVDAALVPA